MIDKDKLQSLRADRGLAFIPLMSMIHRAVSLLITAAETSLECQPYDSKDVSQLQALIKTLSNKASSHATDPVKLVNSVQQLLLQVRDVTSSVLYQKVTVDSEIDTIDQDIDQADLMLQHIRRSLLFTKSVDAHSKYESAFKQFKDVRPKKVIISSNQMSDQVFDKIKTHPIIYFESKNSMDNPSLFKYDVYQGTIENYKWSSTVTKRTYENIKDIAAKQGLSEPWYVLQGRPRADVSVNFIIIARNGEYIWRKYDMGGGSGQNYLYTISGKVKTSDVIRHGKI